MSSVTFRGDPVSREDVLHALVEFDAAYGDDSNGYDGWLEKGVGKPIGPSSTAG